MPLIIILAECGLELIPKRIRNHPSVKRELSYKNYVSQLLDNALHHSAMTKLEDRQKRGRPDIVHLCLLNALGSTANLSGHLKIYVHTLQDKIYEFNPEIRISKNFNRFKGLMAKLLIDDGIKAKDMFLISRFRGGLKELITSYENPEVILLSQKGDQIKEHIDLFAPNLKKNYIAIIGGFQKGSFSERIYKLSDTVRSLSSEPLQAWVALYKTVVYYELTHSIL